MTCQRIDHNHIIIDGGVWNVTGGWVLYLEKARWRRHLMGIVVVVEGSKGLGLVVHSLLLLLVAVMMVVVVGFVGDRVLVPVLVGVGLITVRLGG